MNEETKVLIQGLFVGVGVVGIGGVLIGTSVAPGVVFVLVAIVGFIVTKKVWEHSE